MPLSRLSRRRRRAPSTKQMTRSRWRMRTQTKKKAVCRTRHAKRRARKTLGGLCLDKFRTNVGKSRQYRTESHTTINENYNFYEFPLKSSKTIILSSKTIILCLDLPSNLGSTLNKIYVSPPMMMKRSPTAVNEIADVVDWYWYDYDTTPPQENKLLKLLGQDDYTSAYMQKQQAHIKEVYDITIVKTPTNPKCTLTFILQENEGFSHETVEFETEDIKKCIVESIRPILVLAKSTYTSAQYSIAELLPILQNDKKDLYQVKKSLLQATAEIAMDTTAKETLKTQIGDLIKQRTQLESQIEHTEAQIKALTSKTSDVN